MYEILLSRPTPNHHTHIIFVTFTEIHITRVSQNRFKYAAAINMNLRNLSAKKRPKGDHFSEKVSFKDRSLLKETKLGALRLEPIFSCVTYTKFQSPTMP